MSRAFEEIDHQSTPMGEISLRRRLEPSLLVDVWEVKLGDEFLMSSLTHFYHLAAPSYVQGPAIPPWTPWFLRRNEVVLPVRQATEPERS